jgi:predicted phage-related endonuclease
VIYTQEEIKEHKGFKYIERKGLKFYILEGLSRADWLRLRAMDGALGGSDVGTIMGWNYRQSKLELFYQKIGLNFSATDSQTQYTYWGSKNERAIMHTAQFYDFNDPESYLHNETAGIKIRSISELKFSVRNPAVPFLNCNVDGLIDYDPAAIIARRIAESKTISRKSAEMWESIPPYHLGQVIMYMYALKPMLLEDYAEIYYLKDGNDFYGWEIPQSPVLLEMIVENCEDFYGRVVRGLEIVSTIKNSAKREKFLHEIEPDPDDTEAYSQFLSEAYKKKKKFVTIKGSDKDLQAAREFRRLDKEIKGLEKQQQYQKNLIWQTLAHNSASVIDLEDNGKITFNKRLYVNVTE